MAPACLACQFLAGKRVGDRLSQRERASALVSESELETKGEGLLPYPIARNPSPFSPNSLALIRLKALSLRERRCSGFAACPGLRQSITAAHGSHNSDGGWRDVIFRLDIRGQTACQRRLNRDYISWMRA